MCLKLIYLLLSLDCSHLGVCCRLTLDVSCFCSEMFASRCTCDVAVSHAWDTVQICEQKWPATLLIPVFTPLVPACLRS